MLQNVEKREKETFCQLEIHEKSYEKKQDRN